MWYTHKLIGRKEHSAPCRGWKAISPSAAAGAPTRSPPQETPRWPGHPPPHLSVHTTAPTTGGGGGRKHRPGLAAPHRPDRPDCGQPPRRQSPPPTRPPRRPIETGGSVWGLPRSAAALPARGTAALGGLRAPDRPRPRPPPRYLLSAPPPAPTPRAALRMRVGGGGGAGACAEGRSAHRPPGGRREPAARMRPAARRVKRFGNGPAA